MHIYLCILSLSSRASLYIPASQLSLCSCWDLINSVTANVLLGEIRPFTSFLFTFIKKHTILQRLSNQRVFLQRLSIATVAMLTRSHSYQTTDESFKVPSVLQPKHLNWFTDTLLLRTYSPWPHITQKFRNTAINMFYCSTDDVYRDKLTMKTVPAHTRLQEYQYFKRNPKATRPVWTHF